MEQFQRRRNRSRIEPQHSEITKLFRKEKETKGFFKTLEKNIGLSVMPKKKSALFLIFSVYSHMENADSRSKILKFK